MTGGHGSNTHQTLSVCLCGFELELHTTTLVTCQQS